MKSFSYYAEAFLPLFTIALAALGLVFGVGFALSLAAFSLAFCVLAVLFAVTAPLWGALGALAYAGFLTVAIPFHALYATFRHNHNAS
jgi:hypothetical protein